MAILIPSLVSYINDARITTANSAARLVYTSATNFITKAKIAGAPTPKSQSALYSIKENSSIEDNFAGDTSFSDSKFESTMSVYLGELPPNSKYKVYFDERGDVGAVLWAKTENDRIVGSFPTARTASDLKTPVVLKSLDPKDYAKN
jgi:hypothetical protein